MNKLFVVIIFSLILSGCTVKNLFLKRPAGLEITTIPVATVFLNGENVGETPYANKEIKPGEYTIKLIATSGDGLVPYEIKRKLSEEVTTIIARNLAGSDPDSSGYILTFDPEGADHTYLSVISDPDAVNLNLDGQPSGFTPLSKIEIAPGTHSILLTSPGYLEQTISVNAAKGYNLVVSAKLASQTINLISDSPAASASADSPVSPSSSPSPSPALVDDMLKPYVTILETETGWLRVREEPNGTSTELGKADTGEKLKYLGETTDSGWHKIEFAGKPGYVSGKYVTLTK